MNNLIDEDGAVYFDDIEIEVLKEVSQFLMKCNAYQAKTIVNEVLMLFPMIAWNPTTKLLACIESVSVNGECIQLNIEEYEE